MAFGRSAVTWRALLAAVWLLAAAVGTARGQDSERQLQRILRQADEQARGLRPDLSLTLPERSLLDIGGYHTFTFLNLNDDSDNSTRLLQYDTTVYGRFSIDGAHNGFVRARFRYQDFSPGDSFDERGDRWSEPFLDRYWYEFDLRRHLAVYNSQEIDGDLNLRVGRQFVDWGAGLALSEQLYAVRARVEVGREWSAEGLASITPGDEAIIDFDSSRAAYNAKTKRAFFGGLLRWSSPTGFDVYAYGLRMNDENSDTEARFGTSDPVDFEYNAWYIGLGVSGSIWDNVLFLGEAVYALGDSRSDPLRGVQTKEDVSAVAARGQLTYLFRDANRTQLQAEVIAASGDGDRQLPTDTVGGNLSGTGDHSFNSLGYANTGLAFAPELSNIVAVRMGASGFPFVEDRRLDQLQLGVDLLMFMKYNHAAELDEPTDGDSYLGTELDLYANYRVASDLAVQVRYGGFLPGAAITSGRDIRNFIMVSVTVSF